MVTDRVFEAEVAAVPGVNTVTVDAWDSAGNKTTEQYSITQPSTSGTFQYDPNGNLTQKVEGADTWAYEWDAENQLKRVLKNGAEVAIFLYDPLGRRAQKAAGAITHDYVYDGQDILKEARSDGTVYTYVHGPGIDEPLARLDQTNAVAHYHADGLGSIVTMTDAAGNAVETKQYDAWGNIETGAAQPGYAFTGREWDPETGLYYYRARYYDPKIGRFISEDRSRFRGGINLYSYVANNPTNFVDPDGDIPVVVGIGLAAAGVIVVTGVAVVVFYPDYAPDWLKTVVTSFLPLGPAADALGPEVPDAAIKIKKRREEEKRLLCSMEPCASVPEACPECQKEGCEQ
jgi:RHS repeat-associated protein